MNSFLERLKAVGKQFLILPVIFLIFLPTLQSRFINWDDDFYVYQNRAIEKLDTDHVQLIFFGHVQGGYAPLTVLSFALEKHFFGLNPYFYHLDNLILHLAVVVLIMILGSLFGLSPAARVMAAFLFGIHPMHVESVAWVTERKDVLYAFFYLLAVVSYCYYLKRNHWKALLCCFLFGLLSLLSKPMALSLPLILWLLDWFFKRPLSRKIFLEKIPFLLYAPVVWVSLSVNNVEMFHPSFDAALVFIWTFSFYLSKFIFPLNLSPLYTLPAPISLRNAEYVVAGLIVGCFMACVIRFRNNRWFAFAVLYFLFSIFMLLRVSAKPLGPIFVADRFMYLPSLGFCFLIGLAFDKYVHCRFRRRIVKPAIGLAIVLALAGIMYTTHRQILVWKDSFSFWNFVIKKNTSLAVPYLNRAIILGQAGRYSEALQDLNKALALKSEYAEAFNNRGNVYEALGRRDLAIQDYTKAIDLQRKACVSDQCDPDDILARASSGILEEISKQNIQLAKYLCNRGASYLEQNDDKNAMDDFNEALTLNKYSPEGYYNRGLAHKGLSDIRSAEKDFARAIKLNARMTPAHFQRAAVYAQFNDMKKAMADIEKVLSYDPDNSEAYYYRSKILAAEGEYPLALENLFKARSLGYTINDIEFARLQEAVKGSP